MEDENHEQDREPLVDRERESDEDGVEEDAELEDEDPNNLSERAVSDMGGPVNVSVRLVRDVGMGVGFLQVLGARELVIGVGDCLRGRRRPFGAVGSMSSESVSMAVGI